jgi:hypothetical protein
LERGFSLIYSQTANYPHCTQLRINVVEKLINYNGEIQYFVKSHITENKDYAV